MIGSIERLYRRIRVRHLAPMMLIVIGVPTRPDPTKRAVGTAGVVPLPAAAPVSSSRNDAPMTRRDTRAERGRVLYPAGHVPRDTSSSHTTRKAPCPNQRVVQSRTNSPVGPNS